MKAVLRVGWSISVLSLAAFQHGERLSCSEPGRDRPLHSEGMMIYILVNSPAHVAVTVFLCIGVYVFGFICVSWVWVMH